MENLAYLHLASTYEDLPSSELVSFGCLFNKAAAPDWKRLSGKAWKYMLPLALTLSVLTIVSSALALEKGDQGPSVRSLQQDLRRAGFYQAPITQVYDTRTEDAVRRFQSAAGLDVNGVAGSVTVQQLERWRVPAESTPAKISSTGSTPAKISSTGSTPAKISSTGSTPAKISSTGSTTPSKRRNPNFLGRGDEGEDVRLVQERLRVAGYYYGNSTAIFGPITEEAVRRFQQAYKLDVDGIVGPATLRRLPPIGVGYGEDSTKRRTDGDQLRIGVRGESVRVLQEQLIKAGYLEGEPNGYFGPYTADAVKRFQAANNLAASGIAGPTTRAKLYSLVNTASRSEFNVLEIQRRLRDLGFYKGPLNGVMEDETKRSIKQAQEFYGISLSDVRTGRF